MKKETIKVQNLTKIYPGGIKALAGISFSVKEGEIFGLLGPNGAGKSTTIMILNTLLKPTSGKALVNGYDTVRQQEKVRLSLGYVSQDLAVDDALTGWENLRLQAGFFHLSKKEAQERIDEVLSLVRLQKRAGDRVETYSGGMRKRLDIATSLIHRPKILLLDEPTLGLDIQTRREIWEYINLLRTESNMTILMSTHYMEEADKFCNRIAIVDFGQLIAIDSPQNLKQNVGKELIAFNFSPGVPKQEIYRAVKRLQRQPFILNINAQEEEYTAAVNNGEKSLPAFFQVLSDLQISISRIALKSPTLDDVFLYYTGRTLREEQSNRQESMRQRLKMRRIRG